MYVARARARQESLAAQQRAQHAEGEPRVEGGGGRHEHDERLPHRVRGLRRWPCGRRARFTLASRPPPSWRRRRRGWRRGRRAATRRPVRRTGGAQHIMRCSAHPDRSPPEARSAVEVAPAPCPCRGARRWRRRAPCRTGRRRRRGRASTPAREAVGGDQQCGSEHLPADARRSATGAPHLCYVGHLAPREGRRGREDDEGRGRVEARLRMASHAVASGASAHVGALRCSATLCSAALRGAPPRPAALRRRRRRRSPARWRGRT